MKNKKKSIMLMITLFSIIIISACSSGNINTYVPMLTPTKTNTTTNNPSTAPTTIVPTTSALITSVYKTTAPTAVVSTTNISSTIYPTSTEDKDDDYISLDTLFEGSSISDQTFIEYYKNLGEYNNKNIVEGAIYASPDGDGNGSKDTPYSLEDALDNLNPGDTLYLREGTYVPSTNEGFFINKSGTNSKYITIRNYPGESVVITNSSSKSEVYGIEIEENTSYVIIEGLEIKNISAYNAFGIALWGNNQNHLIIRNNSIHDIKTTTINPNDSDSSANAILFNGENIKPISNVIVANNHIYNNVTGWAESLSIAGNCEYFYVLNNLVENNTNIGIDFYGNAGYCKNQSLDQPRYSLAAGNIIKKSICEYADCAGLYVDGARDILLQYNKISDSLYGIEIGSEEKNDAYPVKNIVVRYNTCINNELSIRIGGYEEKNTGVVTSTKIYNNKFISNYDGYQIVLAKCDGIEIKDNLFYSVSSSIVEFEFSEEYIKNIVFENNTFYSLNKTQKDISFKIYNKNLTFDEFNKKYGLNKYEIINIE